MAAAACDRVKFPWLKHKRSSSEPPAEGSDLPQPSGVSETSDTLGSPPIDFHGARSISQEVVSRPHEPTLGERWTDSLRKSRDRLRRRFSQRSDRSPRPVSDPGPSEVVTSPDDELQQQDVRKSRKEAFLQPVKRFGRVAKRSAVGKPVVRFARTCKRDVPKPYRFIRSKIGSLSPSTRLRDTSPGPRSLSPPNGSGSNNDDEIVFALGYSKEPEEHIYDPVGEPVVSEPDDAAGDDDEDDDEFNRFSRFSKFDEVEPRREPEEYPVPEVIETETLSRTPEPCIKDTSRPGSRSSRTEDFPKSVRFGKKRTSESDSVGVRFKPLSASSSKDDDLGSYHGLQRVKVQLKDDVTGLNLVSKFVQPQTDAVDLPPIEIRQLDEPPRVLRPRPRDTPDIIDTGDTTPVFEAIPTVVSNIQSQPLPSPPVEAQAPFVKAQTPPAKAQTPPVKTKTPFVKAPTPPVKVETPPARVETPFVKAQTPPIKAQTEQGAIVSQILSERLPPARNRPHISAPIEIASEPIATRIQSDPLPLPPVEPSAPPAEPLPPPPPPPEPAAPVFKVHTQPRPVFEAPPPPPTEPPAITLTADCRPPRPPPPAPETLERRKPLREIDNNVQTATEEEVQPVEKPEQPPREPYQPKIRDFCEQRKALTLKPPRKKKRPDNENGVRSQSADQPDIRERRTIAIFGTSGRPSRRRQGRSGSQGGSVPRSNLPPPPRPPPPAPRRPPRSRSRGAVSLVDVRDLRFADESNTEESQDYGDGRTYRRLLDDADTGPYRPTRSLRRVPGHRSLPAEPGDTETAVTSKLVVSLRAEAGADAVQLRTEERIHGSDPSPPPQKPPRSSRNDSHNNTFDSIGDGPDQLEHLAAGDGRLDTRGSVTSDGPRSLHSFQQEELGSGDELMLIVNDCDGQAELSRSEKQSDLAGQRSDVGSEQVPPTAEGQSDLPPQDSSDNKENETAPLRQKRPEYAHVRKRSSLLQRDEPAYDYPPPVPKKLIDYTSPPSSSTVVVAPPRRRPASLSPRRAQGEGTTTWPKRRHTAHHYQAAPSGLSPPPRTVKRHKVRSSTIPRGYKSSHATKPTLYHLAKQKSQEDSVNMKNRPLPPPPPPPRKKPSDRSDPALCTVDYPAPPLPPPPPPPHERYPDPSPPEIHHPDHFPGTGPGDQPFVGRDVGVNISPAGSDPDLSQATDAPSEITLRSEGSEATLGASPQQSTSGRDPGCETTDDEFCSIASDPAGHQKVVERVADTMPVQERVPVVQLSSGQLTAALPRHVLVPHFIERVSTSEMDAASANIVDLTACKIKVTELEVDRIYIREGKVKLIRHEDASDDEGPAGGGGGNTKMNPGRPAPSIPPQQQPPPPSEPTQPQPPSGNTPPTQSAASGASPASTTSPASLRSSSQIVSQASSSSDSSESRPLDPRLLNELDMVESVFRQIGSCLQAADKPVTSQQSLAADSAASVERHVPDTPDTTNTTTSVTDRLNSIKAVLEEVITPAAAAERRCSGGRVQLCCDTGAVRNPPPADNINDSAVVDAAQGDTSGNPNPSGDVVDGSDADRIYGIPAEVADAPGRRVRLSHLLSSFGKGLRKKQHHQPRKERRAHSQFYVDLNVSDSESSGCGDQTRRRSDPSLTQSSSSSSDTLVMGSGTSVPARQIVTAPSTRIGAPEERLQYARVIEEFSTNLASLCKQVAADGPPPPPPDDEEDDQDDPWSVSVSEALVTAPELSSGSDTDSETDTLHTACDAPPPVSPSPSEDASRSYLVARELVTSEETFVDVLKLLNEEFRAAAEAVPADPRQQGIPAGDLSAVLCHLHELQTLNQELLRDLKTRLSNWSNNPVIADVIVRKGPFLKLYSAYIRDFQAQCHMLSDCRHRYPGFAAACDQFEASPRCRKLTLAHYMLKPVQRLPQYRLLLEDYLRHQTADMPDYDNTRAALEVVCEVADHANKSMREGDNFKKLLHIQERLRFTEIVKPGRNFICQGELLKLCRKGPQPRFVILLTDSLLLTRYSGSATAQSGPLSLDYVLPLTGMKVSVPIGASDEYQNEFSIVSTTRSFSLTAGSNKERDDWVNALLGAIEKNACNRSTFNADSGTQQPTMDSKLGEKAPVWVPDSRASMCQLCTTEFTVTHRRHHCRACGKVVCGSCSTGKAPLSYQDNSPGRVCDVCFETLQKDVEEPDIENHNNSQTKKAAPSTLGRKTTRKVPKRLEVSAAVAGCQKRGYLQRRTRKQWKRAWFVLRDRVLYMYRASQDVVAIDSLPVLGYRLQTLENSPMRSYEGVDSELVFQLTHPNQPPLVFHADNRPQAEKWISSLQGATVLT